MKRLFTALIVIAGVAACTSSTDEPKTGNGVNDVHTSCEIRSKWVRTGNDCSLCETGVTAAHCECDSLKAFSGACLDQENARKAACDDATNTCVFACTGDCACIDNCYANASASSVAACKKASDARDGCIAAACADHCK